VRTLRFLYVPGVNLPALGPPLSELSAGGTGLRQAEQVRELERQRVLFPILMILVAVLVQPSDRLVDVRSVEVRVPCAGQQ
jgi:hypothetical protein